MTCIPNILFHTNAAFRFLPKVIEGSYTKKCDVWACGVISYILLSGCAPFDGESHQEIYDAILQGVVDFDFEAWNDISENAKDFIRYLLTYEEEKRPTTEQALQHSWLQEQRKLFLEQSEQRACTQRCLQDLRSFNEDSPYGKLKQAACTAIASQLLSKQEKDEIDEAFRNLDHACDGYLDREDLKRGYRENFDLDFSERDLDEMYKRVNISRTGKIDYSEFAVAMMVQNDMMHDKLDAAFRFFDTDGKGYISAEDINSVLELGEEDYNSQEKILRDADQDGDGVITFMEFRTMMLSTKIRQQRRCSIARTPRNASMALGINSSENSNDYMSGSLQPSSHDSNPNQQPSSVLISHSRRLSSDGLVVLSGRRTSVIDNPLEELQEEELSDNYDDISDDEGY